MSFRFATLLLAGACLGLSGCEQKNTVSDYFAHPETLKAVLQQCQSNGGAPETFDARCKLAYNTAVRMTRLMQAFVHNQTEFGQRIMRAQLHVTELAAQWQIADNANLPTATSLKKQVTNAQQQVDNLRAIVGIFVQM